MGPPLPGSAHGPAREAVHLLRGRHREAGGRGRAGRRQLGRLHDGGVDGYAACTCVSREPFFFFLRVSVRKEAPPRTRRLGGGGGMEEVGGLCESQDGSAID